ncbi:carph-isopro domain-containing protein [Lichenibacterium minor]|uniref:carph-isopro domain-containing protein n=1 Tax=Lichenibacterium minor TaxID=2316528 RepID=UPI003D1758F6
MRTSTRHQTPVQTLIKRVGATYLAGRLGHENVSTVSSWKARNSIPLPYWPALIAAAREKDIDLDEAALVRIHLAPAKADNSSDQADSHAA